MLVLSWGTTFSQNANPGTWLPNRDVSHITGGNGKVFLNGEFDWFGEPYDGYAPVLNLDLSHDAAFPLNPNRVQYAIPDDAGGWYTQGQGGFAHVKADKTLETLPITIDGSAVYGIAKSGNILYFVGQFNMVNGIIRNNVAAFDLSANTVTAWNPGANGSTYSVAATASTVYIGGSFSVVGGLTRHKIAAIDASTGTTTAWNVNAVTSFGYVLDIIPTVGAIYFGGSFTNIGGGSPSRRNFAAVNTTTGALLTFNPRPDDVVRDLLLDGTTLYIAGEYHQIGGVTRYGLTAFDAGTGSLQSFNPTFDENYNGPVQTMDVDGTNLYVGGSLRIVNDVDKGRIAVLDKTTGALVPTATRHFSGNVYAICIVGTKVLVGCYSMLGFNGDFNTRSLVAMDEATGHGFGFVPQIASYLDDWWVQQIHFQGSRLYYLQAFDGSQSVVGALNPDDGSVDPTFNVDITGEVNAWAFTSNTLYLAGNFTQVNGTTRSNFAAVSLADGALLPFVISSPFNGGYVRSMAVANNILYVSGDFLFSDGGITREQLAAWDATTGSLLSWAPQMPGPTGYYDIGAIHNSKVYIIGSVVRRVNAITGIADAWSPDYYDDNGGVESIVVHGNYVYIAGNFSPGLTRVGVVSGSRTAWQPNIEDVYDSEGEVSTSFITASKLYVGGNFSYAIGAGYQSHFAQFDLPAEVANEPPQIQASTSATPAGGIVSIDLTALISDPDDNLDLTTLSLLNDVSELGAAASLDAAYVLTLDYSGTIPAADTVSVEVCDLLEACTQQVLAIDLGSLDLVVFNAVSPNGDGKNDQLTLLNISPSNKVTIFNRWGAVVSEIDNYDNQTRVFRGLSNSGTELSPGTYYYRIDFPDRQETRTGYISLRK